MLPRFSSRNSGIELLGQRFRNIDPPAVLCGCEALIGGGDWEGGLSCRRLVAFFPYTGIVEKLLRELVLVPEKIV